jgi:2-polyprenyl-3-methyl-5-hydroxy-6-metoxy-1,4-benzoquinol methylase
MSDGGNSHPDQLYARLFQPWTLPEEDWPLCQEDWQRVDAITRLPWTGRVVDFGAGDGTLGAFVMSRNPRTSVLAVEQDETQRTAIRKRWPDHPWVSVVHDLSEIHHVVMPCPCDSKWDGAICCEVLEHLTPDDGHQALCDIKRVLKPGAMLCVTVPHLNRSRAHHPGHIRFFNADLLCDAVTQAGFSPTEVGDIEGRRDLPWIWCLAHA